MTDDGALKAAAEQPLVPARILNEHVYCPRLAWLEWEARAFVDNADTAEGTDVHRRIDRGRGTPPEPGEEGGSDESTSVTIASPRLGLVAKLDRVVRQDGAVVPVETKRGKPRKGASPVWEPELAQLTAQVLLLREQGHLVPHAEVFFAETRTRHQVEIADDAEEWLGGLVSDIRRNAASTTPPPPLVDSPKCPRCALVGVCLPDETNALVEQTSTAQPRKLVARDDPAQPLYVMTPGAFVRKKGGRLVLEQNGEQLADRRLLDVRHLAVFGNVTISGGAMRGCLDNDIPVLWFSSSGWFSGYAVPHGGSWVARRIAQYSRASSAPEELAAAFVGGKIRNQRTLLRRLGGEAAKETVDRLTAIAKKADAERDPAVLLGLEGTAARWYFERFGSLLKRHSDEFSLEHRNRRPPTDPVNAMLSFSYALLVRDAVASCLAAGLDPQVGFLHQPRFGRPSLALDLCEEFRPLIADSAVVMAINNGEVRPSHFVRRGGAVALSDVGRKAMIAAYERRVGTSVTHPMFGYQTTYRRSMELQARLLAAVVDGQIEQYRPLTTR